MANLLDLVNRVRDQLTADPSREAATRAIDDAAAGFSLPAPDWDEIAASGQRLPDEAEEDAPPPDDDWRALLRECGRIVHRTAAEREEVGAVLVYTVYGAKGQQWRHVYIVGAYEGAFLDRGVIGEDGRKLYVAVTRSEWSLTITKPDNVNDRVFASMGTRAPSFPEMLGRARRARGIAIEQPGSQVRPRGPSA